MHFWAAATILSNQKNKKKLKNWLEVLWIINNKLQIIAGAEVTSEKW